MKNIWPTLALAAAFLGGCASEPENRFDEIRNELESLKVVEAQKLSQQCSSLEGQSIGFGVVNNAEAVSKGDEMVTLWMRVLLKVLAPSIPKISIPAPRDFCLVEAEIKVVEGSLVNIKAWLPVGWNGKMYAGGGGGFNGGLFGAASIMYEAAEKGYVTVVTDVGHKMSMTAEFASDYEKFVDYGHRGNHTTAVFTKQLIEKYYGVLPERSYFVGGSNGGREALMEAIRYPEDYDGIVAGMPANNFTRLVGISFLWNYEASKQAPDLVNKLEFVQKSVIAKCDAIDGVKDNVIENPMLCDFDPSELACTSNSNTQCLATSEVEALRKIYAGPTLKDGTSIFPGQVVGGEGILDNWEAWFFGEESLQAGMGEEFLRWMVYNDEDWDKSQFDVDKDFPEAMKKAAPIVDATDPDLTRFVAKGGKLIIHHGWADAAISPINTINYYEDIQRVMGPAADEGIRLFMVPGMLHGPGDVEAPTHYDMLEALEQWVEEDKVPERVIAKKYEFSAPFVKGESRGRVLRTRPLCAWPKTAHYLGSGSTDKAENFICK